MAEIDAKKLGRDKILEKIREVFEREGEDFDGDETDEGEVSVGNKPKDPDFPVIIFLLAIAKDILDALDLTLIAIIFTFPIKIFIIIIIFVWGFGKMKFGGFKKMILRTILIAILEMIPVLSIIPTETIFVLMIHFREKKLVKLFNLALEELKRDMDLELKMHRR